MNILEEIILNTQKEVAERKAKVSLSSLESTAYFQRDKLASLKASLANTSTSGIISEIKKKSPSKGVINGNVTVEEVGEAYEKAKASAISVLTDFKYFGGTMEYLQRVREKVSIPILRKDFMVDEYQVIEAKAIGADVILLIAAALTPQRLEDLAKLAKSIGLEVLMEVHDEEELNRSLNSYLDVVGVNNRNLKTFEVSVQTSIDLVEKIPNDFMKISESGLKDAETILSLKKVGYQGFLIGETFMKTDDPGKALASFTQELM